MASYPALVGLAFGHTPCAQAGLLQCRIQNSCSIGAQLVLWLELVARLTFDMDITFLTVVMYDNKDITLDMSPSWHQPSIGVADGKISCSGYLGLLSF